MSIPNQFTTVQEVYASGRYDLSTLEGCARLTLNVALTLHSVDPQWGLLKKNPGQHQYKGRAVDSILYKSAGQSVDIISSSETPEARPAWQVDIPRYGEANWMAPSDEALPPVSTSGGPITPPPPTTNTVDLKSVLDALETVRAETARRAARLEEQLAALTAQCEAFNTSFTLQATDVRNQLAAERTIELRSKEGDVLELPIGHVKLPTIVLRGVVKGSTP